MKKPSNLRKASGLVAAALLAMTWFSPMQQTLRSLPDRMTLTQGQVCTLTPGGLTLHSSTLTVTASQDETLAAVGAVDVVAKAVRQDGFIAFISLLVLISVNLGIMNLLPIPGLDGSRIVFHLIEAVRGKPIKPEREALVHLIGMVFLFSLMIFFTYKDIVRLIFK